MTKILSSQPRKQRLARYNAPHHQARKQMASHLSEELLLKYNRRSMTVITGDEVKLVRGDHKGKSGKVIEIDVSVRKVVIEGVTNKKADGTEVPLPVDPSNLVIVKLNLEDKRREAKLDETAKAQKGEPRSRRPARPPARAERPRRPRPRRPTRRPKAP
jgi:large subunit ribosomal protein L24